MRRQRYHRDANPPSTIPVLLLSSVQSKKRCVESVKESTEFLKRQYEKLDNQFKDPFSAQVITPDSLRLLCLIGPALKAHDKVVFHVFAYNCEPKQIPFIILWRGRKFNNQSRAFCSTVVVSQRPPPPAAPPRCSDSEETAEHLEVFHYSWWRLVKQKRGHASTPPSPLTFVYGSFLTATLNISQLVILHHYNTTQRRHATVSKLPDVDDVASMYTQPRFSFQPWFLPFR